MRENLHAKSQDDYKNYAMKRMKSMRTNLDAESKENVKYYDKNRKSDMRDVDKKRKSVNLC